MDDELPNERAALGFVSPSTWPPESLLKFEENRAFFEEFGARLARIRKQSGVTQVQLAAALGYSQQQIAAFEKGSRRLPLSVVPALLNELGVSFEELMEIEKPVRRQRKRGPPSQLEQQLERISKLPRSEQRFVTKMIEAALLQAEG